jgi:hypothetical protein
MGEGLFIIMDFLRDWRGRAGGMDMGMDWYGGLLVVGY